MKVILKPYKYWTIGTSTLTFFERLYNGAAVDEFEDGYKDFPASWFSFAKKFNIDTSLWQKDKIVIEPHDTWSMDVTISKIIVPMLIQLRDTKHGYPNDLTEESWDEILEKMIWSFAEASTFYERGWDDISKPACEAYSKRLQEGFELFGKYFSNLWD